MSTFNKFKNSSSSTNNNNSSTNNNPLEDKNNSDNKNDSNSVGNSESVSSSSQKTYETTLQNGEPLNKSSKILSCLGSLEELSAYLGIIKSQFFSVEKNDTEIKDTNSSKLFIFAKITQIQENLIDIMNSITITKKVLLRYENAKFSKQKITELETEINKLEIEKNSLPIIPGVTLLESHLLYSKALARKCERQMISIQNNNLGIIPDENAINYLNKLSNYLSDLSSYFLKAQMKESMRYKKK
jgi:ATP:cob(I)alamin adenosyltransferase